MENFPSDDCEIYYGNLRVEIVMEITFGKVSSYK